MQADKEKALNGVKEAVLNETVDGLKQTALCHHQAKRRAVKEMFVVGFTAVVVVLLARQYDVFWWTPLTVNLLNGAFWMYVLWSVIRFKRHADAFSDACNKLDRLLGCRRRASR